MPSCPLEAGERDHIAAELARNPDIPFAVVARRLQRHRSTISREVRSAGGRHAYRATDAHERARVKRARPKTLKLAGGSPLAERVRALIAEGYSPAATAALVRAAGDGDGSVCTETVYTAVYSRMLGLDPRACLRSRRPRRRPRRHRDERRKDSVLGPNVRPIEQRGDPKGVPGHWEGDLVIGARNASAIITLVEICTGFVRVIALPDGYTAEAVAVALAGWLEATPPGVCSSLTWDRGREMAHWEAVSGEYKFPIFFANPHSPWERPVNENTNRQLRFWFPRGVDLSRIPQGEFDRVCDVLNRQPRRRFGWQSSLDRYTASLSVR